MATCTPGTPGSNSLFHDDFTTPRGGNNLITNEFAFWNPGDPSAVVSPDWELTSGSLFSVSGQGWTGAPDDCVAQAISPNATSSNCTDSSIFRLTTKRKNFGSVLVQFDLYDKLLPLAARSNVDSTDPDVDGAQIYVHYVNE